MTTICLLIIFFVHYLHLFEANLQLLQKQFLSGTLDLTKFIDYPYESECLQIVSDSNHTLGPLVAFDKVPLYVRSYKYLQLRNISTEHEGHCETFLIFSESIDEVNKIFRLSQSAQFFPFTKIYFYFEQWHNFTTDLKSMSLLREFLVSNALFGYVLEYNDKNNRPLVLTRDLLPSNVKNPRASFVPKELLHPLVDTNSVKNNFRISSFNCPPYMIYPPSEDDALLINSMDGTEFRLMREVTKNWKKSFKFRDFAKVKSNPYVKILGDLSNKSSDMAMCALWIIEDIYRQFDLSTFYEDQCLTLLVPKQIKLHEATAIYTTLDAYVWSLFLFFFILSIFLLNNIAKMEKSLNDSDSVFTDITTTVLEAVNTATSHSVTRFPHDQTSVKIVLTSWILLSFWMGISYTTIYASRLTSHSYEKPINTVKQVVDKGLHICNAYFDVSTMEPLRGSVNDDCRQLATRSIVYGESYKYRRQLITERRCAIFEVRLTKNYMSLLKLGDDLELVRLLRPMENCVTNHFTGFVFRKHSPYTKLFNWHIRRYQENGIAQKWTFDILRPSQFIRTLFDDLLLETHLRRSLTLVDVSGAFFLLGFCLLIASLTFLAEFMKNRRDQGEM